MPGSAWLHEKVLGIDRRRPMPRFERDSFQKWFRRHSKAKGSSHSAAPRGPIVLLDDCLTSYCEPNVNRAAVQVLQAAGYEVHLAGLSCCGRALISKGLVSEAQQLARENIARLLPWAERGVPIVGCEPSCLLTLVDDYLDLVPGQAAKTVAASSRLVETVLAEASNLAGKFENQSHVLLHGHCHQKALVGMSATVAMLKQIAGVTVQLVDSGCCGMAGSFGYEHYDLSMKIGERVLFPAVRQHAGTIVAPGFSCRHQIQHGAGKLALHPIEFFARQLV
jgi:Fe-S oxidoreductase